MLFFNTIKFISEVDPIKLNIKFTNLSVANKTFTLNIELKEDDPLCICCLFYYKDQEMEFLSDP
jgi:hypothetical protein